MSTRRGLVLRAAGLALLAGLPARAHADEAGWGLLQAPRRASIVLFRHAQAPGVGDPPGFRLGDCSTQRNLDDSGRAQARRLGEQFRQRAVAVTAVWHSMWCRARETAELAFPGLAHEDRAFNSFFEDRSTEPAQTATARAHLLRWRGPGVLVVVTHQVNITALTGVATTPGEGLVVRATGKGLEVLGRIAP